MSTPRYDTFGSGYRQTRRADPRIVEQLIGLLNLPEGATIADIGAGTGNYSNALAEAGYSVLAVEPSAVMRAQAIPHAEVTWYEGYAEDIPLPDTAVDGVICTLAMHHFSEVPASIREMHRIVGDGPIVLLTFDPREGEHFWLYDYFPVFETDAKACFPPVAEVATLFTSAGRWEAEIHPLLLPTDLLDNFCAANWQNPSRYLEPAIQTGTSSFAYADPELVRQGLVTLERDLANGEWEKRYGHVLRREVFDAGYRFVVMRKAK